MFMAQLANSKEEREVGSGSQLAGGNGGNGHQHQQPAAAAAIVDPSATLASVKALLWAS